MAEWIDIENANNPKGYKWQRSGAMFVKNQNGSFVYNENYKQRLVEVGEQR